MSEKPFDESFLKKLEYLHVLAKKVFSSDPKIIRRIKKAGTGLEFADSRPYTPGDDFRTIDWNVAARLGKLIVRLFEEDDDLYVYILVDRSASMALGPKFDHARRVAAALSYMALSNIDRLGLAVFSDALGETLPPKAGRGRIFEILGFLEKIKPAGETAMKKSVGKFISRTGRRGLAVIVSDFFTENQTAGVIKQLRYNKFDVLGVHVFSQDDASPSATGELRLTDSETGVSVPASADGSTLEAYRRAFSAFEKDLDREFVKNGGLLVRAPTWIPFEDIILAVFRKGLFISR